MEKTVIPYTERTARAYEIIAQILIRMAKTEKEKVQLAKAQ